MCYFYQVKLVITKSLFTIIIFHFYFVADMARYSHEPDNATKSCKARGSNLRVHFKVKFYYCILYFYLLSCRSHILVLCGLFLKAFKSLMKAIIIKHWHHTVIFIIIIKHYGYCSLCYRYYITVRSIINTMVWFDTLYLNAH